MTDSIFRRIYVVGFQPSNDMAAVGGFDWFGYEYRPEAVEAFLTLVDQGDGHSLTFVVLQVPDDINPTDRDAITKWISDHLEMVEVSRR